MARISLSLVCMIFGMHFTFAQKFGYVDVNFILSKMPGYKEAQGEIDKLAKGWESEIQNMYKELEIQQANLKSEEILLTADMLAERKEILDKKLSEIKDYQKQIFGFDGLYFLKKKELIKPLQDQIFEAVEKVAKNNRLGILFDKSGDLTMIYTDPIHDYTDMVLEELELLENTEKEN